MLHSLGANSPSIPISFQQEAHNCSTPQRQGRHQFCFSFFRFFPSIKSPTLELKTCISGLLPSI
jgi:hypothetical protein